jgi:hypothetical protein
MRVAITIRKCAGAFGLLMLCVLWGASPALGQSLDITTPSAVRTSEVGGSIAARDLGDSRLTEHFFVFTGTPGDLLITVESRNLNGDVDVFTLTGMRPLLKFTVYEGSAPVTTKGIYLRKREDLILRIQARTPNDDEGTYRVRFGGSFEPISGGPEGGPLSAAVGTPSVDESATGAKSGKRGSRVSSVGARIYEPPSAEVAAAPTPEPEPAEKPARVTTPRATSRSARGRRPATGRTRPATAEEPATEKPATEIQTEPDVAATPPKETEAKPTTGRRRPGRRTATVRPVEKPSPPPEPETGPRLIIETSDGTLINRYMTGVRRVTVENGQVVVVGKDGKVERFLLANVVRMSVGP